LILNLKNIRLIKLLPIFYTARKAFIKSKFLIAVYIYNKIYSIIGYNNTQLADFSHLKKKESMHNNKPYHEYEPVSSNPGIMPISELRPSFNE
jgi:hypothetical protein